jgi:hypothetical protein
MLAGTLAAMLLLSALGCEMAGRRQSRLMVVVGDVEISAGELAYIVRTTAHSSIRMIEESADRIAATTDDDSVRIHALKWKVYAVPAIQEAAFRTDPLLGYLDLWTLIVQMRAYFADGEGADLFGDLQPIAIAACDAMEQRMLAVYERRNAPERRDKDRQRVHEWARDHPISGAHLQRESPAGYLAKLYDREPPGALRAVANLDERVAEIVERLPFYTEYVPKQARWEAEVVLLESVSQMDFAALEPLNASIERVAGTLDELPRLVDEQARSVVAEAEEIIASERGIVTAFITQEREATVRALREIIAIERSAALKEIDKQRMQTIVEVRDEREIVLEEARSIALAAVDRASAEARDIVDAAIWRVAQVSLGLGVLLVIAAFVIVRFAPRRG